MKNVASNAIMAVVVESETSELSLSFIKFKYAVHDVLKHIDGRLHSRSIEAIKKKHKNSKKRRRREN